MRRFLMTILISMFSSHLSAETFYSALHSIDFGKGGDFHLMRFENGRVVFLRAKDAHRLSYIKSTETHSFEVTSDSQNFLLRLKLANSSKSHLDEEKVRETVEPYNPSILKDSKSSIDIFSKMRGDFTSYGECFNRAHVWVYEEHLRSRLNLMKIFMFFTERYIRKYKFKWWFHVTPMVYVKNKKNVTTLDRRYTSAPRQVKTWADIFVKSKNTCKVIQRFDEYWLNQSSQDCYHIYTSMYYVIPRDIEKRDLTGREKVEFIQKEINRAYKNAFKEVPRK